MGVGREGQGKERQLPPLATPMNLLEVFYLFLRFKPSLNGETESNKIVTQLGQCTKMQLSFGYPNYELGVNYQTKV